MRTTSIRRSLLLLSAVATLFAASAGPAFADTTSGQVGEYDMRDDEGAEVVNCRYDDNGSVLKLDKFVAKAPRVWWPDTDSDNDAQHGTVGWSVRIHAAADADTGPWTPVLKSTFVKRTAYEDQPFQDAADAAPFTGRGFLWNKSGSKDYRVTYVIRWYRANGTIRGSAKHQVVFYNLTGDANGDFIGYCPNKIAN